MGVNSDSIANSGTIRGQINLGGGGDAIINTGSIIGAIYLGSLENETSGGYIDTHLGSVVGTIYGTPANDTYQIRGDEIIREQIGGGNDTIYAYGDYALANNVETLFLTGSAARGYGNADANTIYAGRIDAALYGRDGDDVLIGAVGDDRLYGGRGADTLDASKSGGADDLFGGAGDDLLTSGAQDGIVDGGAGIDTLGFGIGATAVTVDLVRGVGIGGDAEGDVYTSIERVLGTADADTITGGAAAESLSGNDGADTLRGGGGDDAVLGGGDNDVLYGDAGNDTINGGLGTDIVHGGDGDDRVQDAGAGGDLLYGEAGNDTVQVTAGTGSSVYGGDGDDRLFGAPGTDLLDGGAGLDTIDYSLLTGDKGVVVDLASGAASNPSGSTDQVIRVENVLGSSLADTLVGDGLANRLDGAAGDDALNGGLGNDLLVGGAGADTLTGGSGIDTADYSGPRAELAGVTINLGAGVGVGGEAQGDKLAGVENVIGVGVGNAADVLTGSSAANLLSGLAGDDRLSGAGGKDALVGGAGADRLTGGSGNDVFRFADVAGAPGGWGRDIVTDFTDGQDKISFVGASAVHAFADLRITTSGTDTIIAVGDDTIRLLDFASSKVSAGDFVFTAAATPIGSQLGNNAFDAPVTELTQRVSKPLSATSSHDFAFVDAPSFGGGHGHYDPFIHIAAV